MGMCPCEIGFLFPSWIYFYHQQVSFKNVFKACGTCNGWCVISCHRLWHAELLMLCDHLMWHWPLTWLAAYLTRSPWVYLSDGYHRLLAVNTAGPHCYVIAANSTTTHVRVVENEALIHSPASLDTLPLFFIPPSCFLPEINLLLNLSFHRGAVGTCHMKERVMDLETRRQFDNWILIS